MSYCVEKGIPHSEFLNWSSDDQAKTLAYITEKSLDCTMCGTADWEWEENTHAYATEESWCRGCYLKSIASEDAGKLPGTTVVLTPVNDGFRARQATANKRQAKMQRESVHEPAE